MIIDSGEPLVASMYCLEPLSLKAHILDIKEDLCGLAKKKKRESVVGCRTFKSINFEIQPGLIS